MTTYVLSGGIQASAAERHVVAATMAPALHDVQAWRFRVVPGLIRVEADPQRLRTRDDPQARFVHLSCGAALLNLRLAAAQLGREPVVRLLPERTTPTLLATVRLTGPHRIAPFERLLYATTLRPIPDPARSIGRGLPGAILNELIEAARLEGATLSTGTVGLDTTPTAVLCTRGDGPAAWLRAGQALQRVVLTAAARAVATAYLSAAADQPYATDLPAHGDTAQAILHFALRNAGPDARPPSGGL